MTGTHGYLDTRLQKNTKMTQGPSPGIVADGVFGVFRLLRRFNYLEVFNYVFWGKTTDCKTYRFVKEISIVMKARWSRTERIEHGAARDRRLRGPY